MRVTVATIIALLLCAPTIADSQSRQDVDGPGVRNELQELKRDRRLQG